MARIDDILAGRDLSKHRFLRRPNGDVCRKCGKPKHDPIHLNLSAEPHPYKGSMAPDSRCKICRKPYGNDIHINTMCGVCGRYFKAKKGQLPRCPHCEAGIP